MSELVEQELKKWCLEFEYDYTNSLEIFGERVRQATVKEVRYKLNKIVGDGTFYDVDEELLVWFKELLLGEEE